MFTHDRRLALALLIFALAALLAHPDVALPASPPACTRIDRVTTVLDGRYADVRCPEGRLRVAVAARQPLPVVGAASIETETSRRTGRTAYTLVSNGQRYGVQR